MKKRVLLDDDQASKQSMKKIRKVLYALLAVIHVSAVQASHHLEGLTVQEAYGDEATIDNCFTVSDSFPGSAIGDPISDEQMLTNTAEFSLDHRIVAFTSCVGAQDSTRLEGVQFELAVTNATTGEQTRTLRLEMIGSDSGVCTREEVTSYIKELHLGYYSGTIRRISFATEDRIYVTGSVDSRQSVQEFVYTELNQLIGLKATETTLVTSMGTISFDTTCVPIGGVPLAEPVPEEETEEEPEIIIVEQEPNRLWIVIVIVILMLILICVAIFFCRKKFHKREMSKTQQHTYKDADKSALVLVGDVPEDSDIEFGGKKKLLGGEESERQLR